MLCKTTEGKVDKSMKSRKWKEVIQYALASSLGTTLIIFLIQLYKNKSETQVPLWIYSIILFLSIFVIVFPISLIFSLTGYNKRRMKSRGE